jgi:hypothetical protein
MSNQRGPIHRPRHLFTTSLLTMLFGLLSLPVVAAPKTDIIIFHNGDRLTGELKSLQRGRLNLNTDATGTIGIEWDKIARVISNQNVQVETSSGARYFGHLIQTEKTGRVVVETEDGPQILDSARVITMNPIETEGISALDIDLTVGYNFAKAGGVTQGSIGVDVDYRTVKRIFSIAASTVTNASDTQTSSERKNFGFTYKRLWRDRWYVNGDFNMEQNDELNLDLRTTIGGGGGRFLIQSNSMLLGLEAGLQVAQEQLQEDLLGKPDPTTSIEATFSVDWDWFLFDDPELDWSTQAEIIPNLSDWGRVRATFDTSLQWEMINDLKWGISFYSTFDSGAQSNDESVQPDGSSSATSDYGVNTTLTYEF